MLQPEISQGGQSGDDKFFVFSGDNVIVTHSSGLFSNCSVSLHAIVKFFNSRQRLPDTVDFSRSFLKFNEPEAEISNVYSQYFDANSDLEIEFESPISFPLRSLFDYREEQFSQVKPFVQKYFSLPSAVLEKCDALETGYGLRPDNLLTICYRGTNKFRDTPLGSYDTFLDVAEKILLKEPGLQVLIQTDQSQFLDRARQRLGTVVVFEELPRTETDRVMHSIIKRGKLNWTQTFIAATNLISKSKYLVLHTGNVARWICLFRGHVNGVLQFYHPKDAHEGVWFGEI